MRVPASTLCLVAGVLACAFAGPAPAVVIDRVGGGNTTAPLDDPGWNNVGAIWVGGGVYIGNGWVLTANHIGSGSGFTIGGVTHAMVAGTYQQLTNNGELGVSPLTDLAMFQIVAPPALPSIHIAATAPGNGDQVTLIGRGRDQQPDLTYWSVNLGVWTEKVPPQPYNRSGFKTDTTQTMRWGTNAIEGAGWLDVGEDVHALYSIFNSGVSSDESQVVYGDSGGAVFVNQSGQWNLAGIILAQGTASGQPSDTAVYGNASYFADLSFYRSQIEAIAVPEPAGITQVALAGLAGGAGLWWRRRSRG